MTTDISTRLIETFNTIPFNRKLGLELKELNNEHVQMTFKMQEDLIGNYVYGILHGGVTSAVLDMAGGMACMSYAVHKNIGMGADELAAILSKTSTIDLQISFINPGRGNLFIADAWLIKSGKNISFARMELKNQEETLIATGNGTYLLR